MLRVKIFKVFKYRMTDNCLNLSVIPQFRGTCWFNAILMIALYSQNVRKILIKLSKKME